MSPEPSIYEALRDALRTEEPVALATVTAGPNIGAKLLVPRVGGALGSLGDPDLDRVVARDALGELEAGLTSTRHYGAHGEAREDTVSVFVESFAPPPRMIIFGAVDFTRALAAVAKVLGYRVVVCDARAVFATRQRFPMADEVVNEWPNRYLEKVGDDLGPRDAVCVLTHDSKFDVPAIVGSLATRVGYLGAMGSRTHARQAHRAAAGGGRHRRGAGPHPRAHRPRHRCPHAGGDRGVDLRRDHQRPHRPEGAGLARRERADPLVNFGIEGRRAAVAAASSGLGFATARALADEGVTVAICSRSRERIEAAAAEIGPRAVPLVADVSTEEGAAGFVQAARDALGVVDILLCNGGGPPPGNFASTPPEAYRAAIELNCLTHIAMCQEAVPAMREHRWGRVIAITSVGVRQPIAGLILSNVARSGLTAFLKTLAREIAGDGVTVNSLLPGFHDTERVRSLYGELDATQAGIPAGVLGDPTDFGRVAAFLCSEAASFVTGTAIPVDGGAYTGLF